MGEGERELRGYSHVCLSFERFLPILSDQSLTIIVFFNPGYLQKGPTQIQSHCPGTSVYKFWGGQIFSSDNVSLSTKSTEGRR